MLTLSNASYTILVSCKTSLAYGHYTWRHNQVLKCLELVLETQRVLTPFHSYQPEDKEHILSGKVRVFLGLPLSAAQVLDS